MATTRTCEHCDATITGRWGNARYCSDECRTQAMYSRRRTANHAELACPICGTTFIKTTSRKYCSVPCRSKAYAARRVEQLDDKTCDHCGETYRPRQRNQRFCSTTCRNRGLGDERREAGEWADRDCPMCGETFRPKYTRQVCCSRTCMGRRASGEAAARNQRECDLCGETFVARDRDQRFCSVECARAGWPAPVGSTRLNDQGYVLVKVPKGTPGSYDNGHMAEHRFVMQEALGRPLREDESVHHVDGDRTRNVLSNLQLRQGVHGAHVAMTCLDCGSHNIGPVELA